MTQKRLLALLLISLSITACSTTKVTGVEYVRGKLLKEETSEPALQKTENTLAINKNAVVVTTKQTFIAKEVKIYEKIKNTNLRTEGTTMTDSPFWAIIGTPGAMLIDVFTLGTQGYTADIWTKNKNEWNTVKDKLENDFFVDERDVYTSKSQALKGQEVRLYANNNFATNLFTDASGNANYDFVTVLYNSNIHPQNLINNQGVTITAKYGDITKNQKFTNKQVPESFFARKYVDMRNVLSERKGRFGNCDFIAESKREFFECYYQK